MGHLSHSHASPLTPPLPQLLPPALCLPRRHLPWSSSRAATVTTVPLPPALLYSSQQYLCLPKFTPLLPNSFPGRLPRRCASPPRAIARQATATNGCTRARGTSPTTPPSQMSLPRPVLTSSNPSSTPKIRQGPRPQIRVKGGVNLRSL
jgi:hypothetical protein